MFAINNFTKNNQDFVDVSKKGEGFYALINLTQGCRLQEFNINDVPIIKEIDGFSYTDSYASSLLFPFVSRTEAGRFQYQEQYYQLELNEPAGYNALHGLIYNQSFEFLKSTMKEKRLELYFVYRERNKPKGFPFDYDVEVCYSFAKNGVSLSLKATNTDHQAFPFTIGWHPYFYVEHKSKATLQFSSHQKVLFDDKLITKEIIDYTTTEPVRLEDHDLDDCFLLNKGNVVLSTDAYELEMTGDNFSYLQIYTPPEKPLVAVEPMLGLSNSLNNDIGKQELKPSDTYKITWKLRIKTNNNE